MTEHTPGPWKAYGNRVRAQAELGFTLAECYRIRWGSASTFVADEAEAAANARLIASAPDLLAALEGALADHNTCDWNGCWHQDAHAAIRKARGEVER